MNNSQQQSLDESVIFSPVIQSCPNFLHCEAERCALEKLLTSGPAAFYTKLQKDRLTPFLSSEEVKQVAGWAEDYYVSDVLLDNGDFEDESGSNTQGYSVQYFPVHSDMPAPCLELGWPEKLKWEGVDQAQVYTNPPLEQMPHIREVVRRLLQGATMLIAIVMDRVTDSAVIGDLYSAASRGVSVYIILNHRSVQDNFTLNNLRHPKIRVRTAGGKTFISRNRKMVEGELKENFVLVDLQTVLVGSYSLTWTDAHLHRQIITVLSGPVVQSFDQEFRIIYAASLPIQNLGTSCRPVGVPSAEEPKPLYRPEYRDIYNNKPEFIEKPSSPPPPPIEHPLDWEALGVIQWRQESPEDLDEVLRKHFYKGRLKGQPWHAAVTRGPILEEPGTTEGQDEDMKPAWAKYRRQGLALDTEHKNLDTMLSPHENRLNMKPKVEPRRFLYTYRQARQLETDESVGANLVPEKPSTSRAPQTEGSSSLSDILKRVTPQSAAKEEQLKRAAMTTFSQSMLDLSKPFTDTKQKTSFYDNLPLTPALALIKKRNDDLARRFWNPQRNFTPLTRTNSFSFGLQMEPQRSHVNREMRKDQDNC